MQKLTIIFLATTLLMCGCDFVKNVNPFAKKEDTMQIYQHRLDSIRRAELLRKQQEEARHDQAIADSMRRAEESDADAERMQVMNRYHLIVGAFKTPSYAQDFNEKILSQGHDSKIIESDNNFNLVTIESFDNYRSAVSEWKRIRDKGEHLVWLYIKDN